MALTLEIPYQENLTRPTTPWEPNGIAHATSNPIANTKADRITAKLAWADYVQDYKVAQKVGDSSGPAEFPDGGEITYSDD